MNSPVSVSTIAIVCCFACRSQPTIFISASFVPSLLVGYCKVYSGRRGADVVMSSPTPVLDSYAGIGMSGLHRKLLIRITSLLLLPRVRASCLPPHDQEKSKIRPDLKFVICFGGPPVSFCSQRLETPFLVNTYCKASPFVAQRGCPAKAGQSN